MWTQNWEPAFKTGFWGKELQQEMDDVMREYYSYVGVDRSTTTPGGVITNEGSKTAKETWDASTGRQREEIAMLAGLPKNVLPGLSKYRWDDLRPMVQAIIEKYWKKTTVMENAWMRLVRGLDQPGLEECGQALSVMTELLRDYFAHPSSTIAGVKPYMAGQPAYFGGGGE